MNRRKLIHRILTVPSQASNPFNNNVKLPTICPPKFDSDVNSWLAFKDTYLSLIHNNPAISDIMKQTARDWEGHRVANKVPTLENLQQFLKMRAEFLETLEINHAVNKDNDVKLRKQLTLHTSKTACNFCAKADHFIYTCEDFTVKERLDKVKSLNLCLNCLCSSKHDIKRCRAGPCKICKKNATTVCCI